GVFEPVYQVSSPHMSNADLVKICKKLISRDMIDLLFEPIISSSGTGEEPYRGRMNEKPVAMREARSQANRHHLFATEVGRDLDRQVIALAVRRLKEQLRSAPKTCLFLSINEASIADTQFLPWLRNLLKESGVDASHMVFQLREIDIGRNLGKA